MPFRDSVHHLTDLLMSDALIDPSKDWPYLLVIITLTLVTGPWLPLVLWIQRWNAQEPWDVEDHWAGTKQFTIAFGILDVLLILVFVLFQPALSMPWPHLFAWYLCWMLLTPAFALLAERIDPRAIDLQRVLLPSEQAKSSVPTVPPGAPTIRKQAARSTSGSATTPLKSKKRKGRSVPLGQILLEERETQQQQALQIRFSQPPVLPDSESGKERPISIPEPPSPPAAPPEPKSPSKPEQRKPESLDNLF